MSRGTPSFGKKNKKNCTNCARCGRASYHKRHQRCSSCGFPEGKIRTPASIKARRRRGQGTGRMKHLKKFIKLSHDVKRGPKGHPLLRQMWDERSKKGLLNGLYN